MSVLNTGVYPTKGEELVVNKCVTLVDQPYDRRRKPFLYQIQVEAISTIGPFFIFYYSEGYYIAEKLTDGGVRVLDHLCSIYYNLYDDIKCLGKLIRFFGAKLPSLDCGEGGDSED
jgi:hypothetical protein